MTEKKPEAPKLQPWQIDMANAVTTRDVQNIAKDFRAGPSQPSSLAGPTKADPKPANAAERPLEVPGLRYVDQICDAFDAADRKRRGG